MHDNVLTFFSWVLKWFTNLAMVSCFLIVFFEWFVHASFVHMRELFKLMDEGKSERRSKEIDVCVVMRWFGWCQLLWVAFHVQLTWLYKEYLIVFDCSKYSYIYRRITMKQKYPRVNSSSIEQTSLERCHFNWKKLFKNVFGRVLILNKINLIK